MRLTTGSRVGIWLALFALLALAGQLAWAQSTGADQAETETTVSLWQIVRSGSVVGWVVIALSFVALGLVIDHFRTIQTTKLIPQSTVGELQRLIRARQFKDVLEFARLEDSLLSRVVGGGIVNLPLGYREVRTAMEDEGRKQLGTLRQRTSYLNLIGVVAPMLGLLGTVLGMISSFNALALSSAGVRPAALARGISMALVTTLEGLVVAIPALFFFHYFQNRISTIAAELETTCEQLLRPVKLPRTTRPTAPEDPRAVQPAAEQAE